MKQQSGHLMASHSLPWAETLGVEVYNWESTSDRTSGVYRHKAQW